MTNLYIDKQSNSSPEIDGITRNFYQYSGLSCRVLGIFFLNNENELIFGTDCENFLSPYIYSVYKPQKEQLKLIINENKKLKESESSEKIGVLRYSSSKSYDTTDKYSPDVLLRTEDIVARRTAFFGMTRTGKSNTIKIIISAIEKLNNARNEKMGQIVFDINGEYTFSNKQDEGSIYDRFKDKVVRCSTSQEKVKSYEDVRIIKYDFYNDDTLKESFTLLSSELASIKQQADYIKSFISVDMFENDGDDNNEKTIKKLLRAIYKCILYRAGFNIDKKYKLQFEHIYENNDTIDESCKRFENINLKELKLKCLVPFLSVLKQTSQGRPVSGFRALTGFKHLHYQSENGSDHKEKDYKQMIDEAIRNGKIVLVDLSTVSAETQQIYIDRLCSYIFEKSMDIFTEDKSQEYIQMYFEEAHNIFLKDDKDLKNIYNRLAKEGAKLNIGISYSTQEVSSISSSILKNTQNWFISHLNDQDEIKALEKYYDFKDFSQSIIRNSDVGFARVKSYSNNFIIPVQIDPFKN